MIFMWHFLTYAPEETYRLGRVLGEAAPAGACLLLSGEMGAGKTLFAQGVACGLKVAEQIVSPTFTIANQYFSGRLPFVHMDLYRLESYEDVLARGIDEYFDNKSVALVEWPNVLEEDMPTEYADINITKHYDEDGGEWRGIEINAVGDLPWLEEALRRSENLIS
jgi:tRNA threonylcarbamoyladenosine biosynthesis protein TsaE